MLVAQLWEDSYKNQIGMATQQFCHNAKYQHGAAFSQCFFFFFFETANKHKRFCPILKPQNRSCFQFLELYSMPSGHSYLLNNQDIFQAQANETAMKQHNLSMQHYKFTRALILCLHYTPNQFSPASQDDMLLILGFTENLNTSYRQYAIAISNYQFTELFPSLFPIQQYHLSTRPQSSLVPLLLSAILILGWPICCPACAITHRVKLLFSF